MENKPIHIMLADDDEADRLLFTEALKELKIKSIVQTVKDGEKLMNLLKEKDTYLPQMLFLDLNMPRKSGLECLKEIRNSRKLKDIYIAIYSTSDSEKDMEETFINGANIYITKPADYNSLKQVLEKAVDTAFMCSAAGFSKENFLLKL